jgi:hypothetical protein
MGDTRRTHKKVTPELYTQNPKVKLDLDNVEFTDKSWELIDQGLQGQQFVINCYIDSETGKQTLHCWPTGYIESPQETELETKTRIEDEGRLKQANYKDNEIARTPFFMTGVIHKDGADLDKKNYDSIKFPYLAQDSKKTTYRMGGQLCKYTPDTTYMPIKGRSTLNWQVFILNEVFESAFYFGIQSSFNRPKGWPLGVEIARSLPLEVITGWLKAIEKRNKTPSLEEALIVSQNECRSLNHTVSTLGKLFLQILAKINVCKIFHHSLWRPFILLLA